MNRRTAILTGLAALAVAAGRQEHSYGRPRMAPWTGRYEVMGDVEVSIAELYVSVAADVGAAIAGLTAVDEKVNGPSASIAWTL